MSEKFNSSNMGDFIRKIDVRGDGKQDGKEEERLEQLAIDRLNQMQTNGATTDQLEKAFEDFADALIQKYVPLIEANIAQVSVLYGGQKRETGGEGGDGVNDGNLSAGVGYAKECVSKMCNMVPGWGGQFLKETRKN